MAMATVLVIFCILVVLNASGFDANRLLLNTSATDSTMSRDKVVTYFRQNRLGLTPPMG